MLQMNAQRLSGGSTVTIRSMAQRTARHVRMADSTAPCRRPRDAASGLSKDLLRITLRLVVGMQPYERKGSTALSTAQGHLDPIRGTHRGTCALQPLPNRADAREMPVASPTTYCGSCRSSDWSPRRGQQHAQRRRHMPANSARVSLDRPTNRTALAAPCTGSKIACVMISVALLAWSHPQSPNMILTDEARRV